MKRHFIALLTLSLFQSCIFDSKFKDIGDEFEYGYIDVVEASNVYFRDQGIFSGYVNKVRYNYQHIIAYVVNNREAVTTPNCVEHGVFLVVKKLYSENPDQKQSEGVVGPLSDGVVDSLFRAHRFKEYKFDSALGNVLSR